MVCTSVIRFVNIAKQAKFYQNSYITYSIILCFFYGSELVFSCKGTFIFIYERHGNEDLFFFSTIRGHTSILHYKYSTTRHNNDASVCTMQDGDFYRYNRLWLHEGNSCWTDVHTNRHINIITDLKQQAYNFDQSITTKLNFKIKKV